MPDEGSETVNIALKPLEPSVVAQTAILKRIFDLWMLDRTFRNAYREDPSAALCTAGLDAEQRAAAFLLDGKRAADGESVPASFLAFQGLINQRVARNDGLSRTDLVPADPCFGDWRERQIRRCLRRLGPKARYMSHLPVAYELSLGCSVGCPFCGVSAGPLKGLFRYTKENAALWRSVLAMLHSLWGDAAGTGPCYYANEPLDNPDYESFLGDYWREFRVIPQTTTAAATRDVERTRALLRWGQETWLHFDRLSVLSERDMRIIFRSFRPEELLYTDLLPQFAEAPANCMKRAGRNAEGEGEPGTIACVSGFIINMAERSVRLVTPTVADTDHPTGELIPEKRSFTCAEDLAAAIRQMTENQMIRTLRLSDLFPSVRQSDK